MPLLRSFALSRVGITTKPGQWLTARRLRAHGTILAVCLWSLYIWTIATPGLRDRNDNLKGTDFLHFYTLGVIAAEYRGADLYDMHAQAALATQLVPQAAGIKYLPLYPPQVSILFAPLAYLSYASALAVWWVFSAAIYAVCCYCVWQACPNLRSKGKLVVILATAFPGFFHLIAWGQTSALALACFALLYFWLRAQREFFAGIVLGCLIFKPQLGLAAAVVFISIGAWKAILGAALSAAAELSVGVLYYGMYPLRRWGNMLWHVRRVLPLLEPRPYQTHSLRTFWTLLIPWNDPALALYIVSAALVLGMTIVTWKRSASLTLRYSSLLLATVLVAPHFTVYDLVILVPTFLLLADWMAGYSANVDLTKVGLANDHSANDPIRWLGTLLYLVYLLPLFGPLTRWTHVQLSVVAMAACVYVIGIYVTRISKTSREFASAHS
jgi:alpha-1,2-mannosyltransferase